MKKLQILLSILVVSVLVALAYFYFEAAVHYSVNFIWNDWLETGTNRLLVIPLCLILSLAFFGVQHFLDPKSEKEESHGLGSAPAPTLTNLGKVLLIGFFSLLAGASLGPEAILVPACLLIGGIIGVKVFKKDTQLSGMLSMVGFIALFAAFFDSFIAGMLGLILVTKEVKVKVTAQLVIIAAIASLTTVYILSLLESSPFTTVPPHVWKVNAEGVIATIGLVAAGYGAIYMMGSSHATFDKLRGILVKRQWWEHGIIAAGGLSFLYLLGGPLVQFTGNESIVPMIDQSTSLGLSGLIVVFLIKVLAISWSKALGYRGGLVFPSVFVAATLVVIAQTWAPELSFIIGLLAVLIGMFLADRKVKILV